jgi:recombination protein RecT
MSNELKIVKKDVVDVVEHKINTFKKNGEIHFPPNYSPQNAMKSAWLLLQNTTDKNKKPVLESCSKDSIANSLLDMVVQGLTPAKNQCYFIAYDGQLNLTRSYFGTVAVVKRLKGVKHVVANCIFEGDEFEYEVDIETGYKRITKHKQDFKNIDPNKIEGAYAIVITEDDEPNYIEIMNINQVYASWQQSKAYPFEGSWEKKDGKSSFVLKEPLTLKPSSVHAKFTDQMVNRTVINRACKMFTNTSDDSDLLIESFNRTTENEYVDDNNVDEKVTMEIEQNANKQEVKFDKTKAVDVEPTTEEEPEQMDMEGTPFEDEGPDF